HTLLVFFFPLILPPPPSPLFPYTTALPICRRQVDGELDVDGEPRAHRLLGRCHPVATEEAHVFEGELVHSGSLEAEHVLHGIEADRKSTRLNSSHRTISYAVFCLKKKTKIR